MVRTMTRATRDEVIPVNAYSFIIGIVYSDARYLFDININHHFRYRAAILFPPDVSITWRFPELLNERDVIF